MNVRLPDVLGQGGERAADESFSVFCIMLPKRALDLLPLDVHALHSLLAYWYHVHGPAAIGINLTLVENCATLPITGAMSEEDREDRVWEAEITEGSGEKTGMMVWWHRHQLQFHPLDGTAQAK